MIISTRHHNNMF